MTRKLLGIFIAASAFSYLAVFQLPYYVWTFALSQNYFSQNGMVMFRDIIYHHTQLPLFVLFGMSKIFGNTPEMLRISSFLLLTFFGYGIFLLGRRISEKVAVLSFLIFLVTFLPLFNNFNIEEMLASLFCLYATYFYLKFWDKSSPIWIFLSGVFVALGIMSKQSVGLIVVAYFLVTIWYIFKNQNLTKQVVRGSFYFVTGAVLGTLPFFAYYISTNSLGDFLYWNVVFNFTIYPKQSVPYAFSEGMSASLWLFLAIIPSAYLLLKSKIGKSTRLSLVLLAACTVFLSTSLLPSFLTYKMLPFYPYPIVVWAIVLTHLNKNLVKAFVIAGLILLIPHAKTFYVDYLPNYIFNRDFIIDYGEDELNVVAWLRENTKEKSPIMNLGHHYIATLAERLPANKYVYLFPWLVSPFEKSTNEILDNPPSVVIVDWRTFDDFPVLNSWQFIVYVKNNYKTVARYGTYEILTK